MQQLSRIERRSLLTGWIKWTLLPVILLGAPFFDAWLNVQVRYKDYELGRLNAARRELNAELDMVRAKEASISGVEHLTEMAEQMCLASPTPQQFKTIVYREAPRRIPMMNLAQTVVPPQRVVISLEGASAPVQNSSDADTGKGNVPTMIASPQNDNLVVSAQPYAPAQNIHEDPELSDLTVEDMLGRL